MTSQDPVQQHIADLVKSAPVVLFMKGNPSAPQCGFSARITGILAELIDDYKTVDVLANADVRQGIKEFSNWPTIPQLYIDGEFIGGCDIVIEMAGAGELHQALGVEVVDVAEPSITITEAAAEVLQGAPRPEGSEIRLRVSKGFEYELNVGPAGSFDFRVESNGVTLAIDRMSASRADGVRIDYVTEGAQSGFRITNPNEPAPQ